MSKSKQKKEFLGFRLPYWQKTALSRTAENMGISTSELMRYIITEALKQSLKKEEDYPEIFKDLHRRAVKKSLVGRAKVIRHIYHMDQQAEMWLRRIKAVYQGKSNPENLEPEYQILGRMNKEDLKRLYEIEKEILEI